MAGGAAESRSGARRGPRERRPEKVYYRAAAHGCCAGRAYRSGRKTAPWVIPGGCGYLSELLADEVPENGHCSVYTSKGQMESYLASGNFRVICPSFAAPAPVGGAAGNLSLRAGVFLMGDKALCAKFSPCAVSVLSCHTKEDLL